MGGVFALLFSAAAAFATTGTLTTRTVYFWNNESTKTQCLSQSIETPCTVASGICRQDVSAGNRQLFDNPACTVTLKAQSGF